MRIYRILFEKNWWIKNKLNTQCILIEYSVTCLVRFFRATEEGVLPSCDENLCVCLVNILNCLYCILKEQTFILSLERGREGRIWNINLFSEYLRKKYKIFQKRMEKNFWSISYYISDHWIWLSNIPGLLNLFN